LASDPFSEFLNRYIAKAPGPIKSDSGRVIGEHVGLSFYTLGQRQGLGIGGVKAKGAQLKALQAQGMRGAGEHEPWFVARKDLVHNTLWVVQGHDHPWLLSERLQAQDCSWVAGLAPSLGTMAAKTRYRQADAPCDAAGQQRRRLRVALWPGAMGRHPRPVGGAVRRRGLPGRRRDPRLRRAHTRGLLASRARMSTVDEELYPCVGVCMVDEVSGLCMGCGKPVYEPAPPPEPR
jgi:hypothetical protein